MAKPLRNIKISEIFSGIQAEGRFIGYPALFIRTSGCSRSCFFCDTKYHVIGKEKSVNELAKIIRNQPLRLVIISGGEPTLWWDELVKLWRLVNREKHFTFHIETNGDLLYSKKVGYSELLSVFSYVAISPKEVRVARQLYRDLGGPLSKGLCDLKVVSDMDLIGCKMLRYATIVMALTTGDIKKDIITRKKAWKYCIDRGIRYSPRLHVELFGSNRRGI